MTASSTTTTTTTGTAKASPLVNRKRLRALLLDVAKAERAHPFSRVSAQALDEAEGVLRQWARRKVSQQPSKGETIT